MPVRARGTPERFPALIVERAGSAEEELWRKAYLPALQEALGASVGDVGRMNLAVEPEGDETVSEAELEHIQRCPYLIIDTTGNHARTCLLYGYALAHRKPVVHVHRARSRPPVRVASSQSPWIYSGPDDLREYLSRVVTYYQSRYADAGGGVLEDFMVRCGFPLLVLEGDGRYQYALPPNRGDRPVYVSLTRQDKFRPPEPWRSEFRQVLRRQIEHAKAAGEVLFNGDLVRLLDYHPMRDERSRTRGIRLDCQPTDYYSFVSSNHCWDFVSVEVSDRLRTIEQQDLSSLRTSVLANPLTVSVSLILDHKGKEWIVIQHRNRNKNFHGKQDFQCAAGGMVSATRDLRTGGIDLYATAVNELEEEVGLKVREEQVVFLGLLRETRLREVGLVAEVEVDADPGRLLTPRGDTFESLRFTVCEASPEAFADFLRANGPRERFAPLGVAAILFSLLRRYSPERVEAAMTARP